MTSILKADTIQDTDGNNIINENSNTITIGASGDTITIPSGATITNSGTATGFGGITEADQYRLTAEINSNANPISSNWERVDTDGFGKIGTGISQSSGVFSFPSTGVYLVLLGVVGETNGDPFTVLLQTTTDDSSYNEACVLNFGDAGNYPVQGFTSFMFDVTDTSTHKVSVRSNAMAGNSNTRIFGDTTANYTHVTFTRLGDT